MLYFYNRIFDGTDSNMRQPINGLEHSASSAAALVFYLPGVCTHTDTEGKQRKAGVRNILNS